MVEGASSCALLGGFAIGARVSLLRQHSAEREMSASALTRYMPGSVVVTMKVDVHDADTRWQTKGVNSTFQNDTSVACVAQRYASYTLLLVREPRSFDSIYLSTVSDN